jgi:peptidoglycan/LPS O-acetylase OafA/YrhL
VLRNVAALTVLLDHASACFELPWFPGGAGHHAVIVFFVLSGFVISNLAETRAMTARQFVTARLARLWSVLVPAIALTVLCDGFGRTFGPLASQAYAWSPIDHPLIRIGAAVTFTAESWVSIQPLSNFPVWSLAIEFWYYMAFAGWMFLPRGRRAFGVTAALLFSGPKGILLSPVWVMGAALQWTSVRKLGPTAGASLFFLTLFVFFWLVSSGVYGEVQPWNAHLLGEWVTHHLAEARMFWFDWLAGITLTLHLAGAPEVVSRLPLERFERPIRWCANTSFAAYLFHMPILHLLAAFLAKTQWIPGVGVTLVAIALLGPLTERSKPSWYRAIDCFVGMTAVVRERLTQFS